MASIQEIRSLIYEFAKENFGDKGEVIKLAKTDRGWDGELELTRTDEYKKRHGRPQVIERYRIAVEEEQVISFERIETRSRGEVEWKREN